MDKDEIDLGLEPTSAQVTQTTFGSDFAMDLRG
jgi:hypothetical protein